METTTTQKQTVGQYRVGSTFNPCGHSKVDLVKSKAADLIDTIEEVKQEAWNKIEKLPHEFTSAAKSDPNEWIKNNTIADHQHEIIRLCKEAQDLIETAAMYAVKAVTKPEKK